MGKWLRWLLVIVGIVLFVGFVIAAYWFTWDWTGFSTKTLWDWLNLLGVLAIPVVAGLGVAWYTTKQTQASEVANEQQHKTELEIAADNQREAALQAYIDKISELLLENNLRHSNEKDEVRNIARVRTLTVLPRLDPLRKASILLFLCESGLIDNDKHIIDLRGADLSNAKLNYATLCRGVWDESTQDIYTIGINLSSVNLCRADLSHADLWSSNMNGANLSHADFNYARLYGTDFCLADLSGANLSHAILNGALPSSAKDATDEQLSLVKSLKGAIMPDGSVHP